MYIKESKTKKERVANVCKIFYKLLKKTTFKVKQVIPIRLCLPV